MIELGSNQGGSSQWQNATKQWNGRYFISPYNKEERIGDKIRPSIVLILILSPSALHIADLSTNPLAGRAARATIVRLPFNPGNLLISRPLHLGARAFRCHCHRLLVNDVVRMACSEERGSLRPRRAAEGKQTRRVLRESHN